MIKGIIFDADGTLLNSMHIWEELGERYLAGRGIKAREGLAQALYPMTLEQSSVYLKENYSIEESFSVITTCSEYGTSKNEPLIYLKIEFGLPCDG